MGWREGGDGGGEGVGVGSGEDKSRSRKRSHIIIIIMSIYQRSVDNVASTTTRAGELSKSSNTTPCVSFKASVPEL